MLTMIAAIGLAPEIIRLWSGDAPGAKGKLETDIPTITVFRPEKPCGSAVVVCPGGGYGGLADHEGSNYAKFLNRFGVTAFVLKYRLGSNGYRHPSMLQDAARAVRVVRTRASEYKIQHDKIGIMGSSAGGHLASTLLTHYDGGDGNAVDIIDRASSKPDFGILCYAVIDMGKYAHAGSRSNLLGEKPSQELIDQLSNHLQVNKNTPPTFLWTTGDDSAVPAQNSLLFAGAMLAAGVDTELHVYPKGPHGLGLGGDFDSNTLLPWTHELHRWMREHGWSD